MSGTPPEDKDTISRVQSRWTRGLQLAVSKVAKLLEEKFLSLQMTTSMYTFFWPNTLKRRTTFEVFGIIRAAVRLLHGRACSDGAKFEALEQFEAAHDRRLPAGLAGSAQVGFGPTCLRLQSHACFGSSSK